MAIPLLLVFFKLASVCTCPSDDFSPALGDPLAWKRAGSSHWLSLCVAVHMCLERDRHQTADYYCLLPLLWI